MEALFLGIDVGTTKIKAVLFDDKGNELKAAKRNAAPLSSADGSVLQDMNVLWKMVAETIREVTQDSSSTGEVKGIGITAQGDGLWMLDGDGKPVQAAPLWTDGRAASYIEKWERQNIISKSGRVVFSGSPLAFSAWFYENHPGIMEKAEHVIFCKDWVKYCLTGKIFTDETDMSDASLIDVRTRKYSKDLLGLFGAERLFALLPQIRKCTDVIGYVTEEAADFTGLPAGVPVVNGMIDVSAAAVGNGVLEPMSACSIVGTTVYNEIVVDSIGHHLDKKENPPSVICHAQEDRWLLTFGTMLGTPNLDWFVQQFCSVDRCKANGLKELEDSLQKIAPGSEGIIYHPYLGQGGERAPFVKPTAAAQFFGLKAHHTKEHLLRSVYEGVAYSMKDCYENFPIEPKYIRLAGGGCVSSFWCQMFASSIGKPVEITYGNEIGAKGAAITAAVGIKHFSGFKEGVSAMVRVKETYEPIAEEVKKYNEAYDLYTSIYRNIWEVWDKRVQFLRD